MDYKDRMCAVTGCPNLGSYNKKDSKNGKIYRSPLCGHHSKLRWGKKNYQKGKWQPTWLRKLKSSPCCLCGWDRAGVDAHRVVHGKDGGSYKQDNVIGLCPNCHRLVHSGIIKL